MSIERRQGGIDVADKDALASEIDRGQKENVDKFFNWARDEELVTSKASKLFT